MQTVAFPPRPDGATPPAPVPSDAPPAPAQRPPAADAAAPIGAGWQPVDPRVVDVWRIGGVATALFLAVVPAAAVWMARDDVAPAVARGLVALVALLTAALVARALLVPRRRWRALAYRVDDADVRLRDGLWWRRLVVVPIARVEHVRTSSGPLERRAGLATLTVQTAGTENAHIAIPGLDAAVADALREVLAARAGGRDVR